MRKRRRAEGISLAFFCAVLISGCAEQHDFDRAAAANVTTLVMPVVAEPARLTAINGGNPGYMFGIVGAALASSAESSRREQFNNAVTQAGGVDLGMDLASALVGELKKDGYAVETGSAISRPDSERLFPDYAAFASLPTSDAVIDIAINDAGYRGTLLLPYRPYVWTMVRVIRPSDSRVIYAQRYAFDSNTVEGRTAGRSVGTPDDSCIYSTSNEVMTHASRAIECLKMGVALTAQMIAADLRRR